MRMHIRLYAVWAVVLMVVTTGCLRSASDPDFQAPQGLDRSTETPRPTLTHTPGPSPTAVVYTTEVLVEVTTIVEVTSTPEPTDTYSAFAVLESPTPIPSLDPFAGVMASTETPMVVAQAQIEDLGIAGGEQVEEEQVVPTETLDPLFAEATQFVLNTTLTVQAATLTAQGPVQQQPSLTPTIDPFTQQVMSTPSLTPTTAFVPGSACVHEVIAGENLFRLSMRYGVTVADIANASGVQNIQLIYVGQMLTIPGCGTTGITPPPTRFPTATYGAGFSGAQSTGGGAVAGGTSYTIQQGDTLFEISLRYGVPVSSIVAANPSITDPNYIIMNTTITIPPQ